MQTIPFHNFNEITFKPRFVERYSKLTEWDNAFVLIILGHNQGAGLKKASGIHSKVREKTVVVYNYNLEPGAQTEYEKLGFSRFMQRMELSRLIDEGTIFSS